MVSLPHNAGRGTDRPVPGKSYPAQWSLRVAVAALSLGLIIAFVFSQFGGIDIYMWRARLALFPGQVLFAGMKHPVFHVTLTHRDQVPTDWWALPGVDIDASGVDFVLPWWLAEGLWAVLGYCLWVVRPKLRTISRFPIEVKEEA